MTLVGVSTLLYRPPQFGHRSVHATPTEEFYLCILVKPISPHLADLEWLSRPKSSLGMLVPGEALPSLGNTAQEAKR